MRINCRRTPMGKQDPVTRIVEMLRWSTYDKFACSRGIQFG
jgi:hypothetical protein